MGSSDEAFFAGKKDPAIAKIKNKTLKVIIIPQSIVISLNSLGMTEIKRYLIVIIIPKKTIDPIADPIRDRTLP